MRRRRSVLSLFGVTRAGDPSCVLNFDGTTDALEGDVDKYPDEDDTDDEDNQDEATHNAVLWEWLDQARRLGLEVRSVAVGGGRFLAGAGITINSIADGLPLPQSAVPERYDRAAGYPGPLVAPPSFPEACFDRAGPTAPGSLLGIPGVSFHTVAANAGLPDPDSTAGRSQVPARTTGTGLISFRGETGTDLRSQTPRSGGRQVGQPPPTKSDREMADRYALSDEQWLDEERRERLGLDYAADDADLLAAPRTMEDILEAQRYHSPLG